MVETSPPFAEPPPNRRAEAMVRSTPCVLTSRRVFP